MAGSLIGGITFGLLWVAAKLLFVTYSGYATVYVRLYGSSEIVLLLPWVYYSAVLLLFGAVVALNPSNTLRPFSPSAPPAWLPPQPSPDFPFATSGLFLGDPLLPRYNGFRP